MITDDEVQEAFDYLADAQTPAKAKAYRLWLQDYTHVLKAKLMGQSNEKSVNAQERFAYSHPEYEAHLKLLQAAREDDEIHAYKFKAADKKLEVWRTQQSNQRAMGKTG
jgi:hypothetical protein